MNQTLISDIIRNLVRFTRETTGVRSAVAGTIGQMRLRWFGHFNIIDDTKTTWKYLEMPQCQEEDQGGVQKRDN